VTAGTVYHIVVKASGGGGDAANCATFLTTTPHNGIYVLDGTPDIDATTMASVNGGLSWTDRSENPVYVIDFSSQEDGVSYASQAALINQIVFGSPTQQWIAETFSVSSTKTVTGFKVRARAPISPSTPLNYELVNYSGGTILSVIASGTITSFADSQFNWHEGTFPAPPTLAPGNTYALVFFSTSGTSG